MYKKRVADITTCNFIIPILVVLLNGCAVDETDVKITTIQEIVDVKLSVSGDQNQQLEIKVSGYVSSPGWTKPVLIASEYLLPPDDGIYEFTFYAMPPLEPGESELTSIELTYRLSSLTENLQGVRIISETNKIVAMLEPKLPLPVSTIIAEIERVQLLPVNGSATQIDINVQGKVLTTGWSNSILIAHNYTTPPQDGIYDFTFYATPPNTLSTDVITPISLSYRLDTSPTNFKGVRIYSDTNNIVSLLVANAPPPVPITINEILNVTLSVVESFPPQLVISVSGVVDQAGWTNSSLVPHEYIAPPLDGIYEFTYYATPPATPGTQINTAIELTHTINSIPSDMRGVRIFSSANNVETMFITAPPVPVPAIINQVVDVQLFMLSTTPRGLDISVSGNVTSTGWTSPMLVPLVYLQPPPDGIYEFTFNATPPTEPSTTVLTSIFVIHWLEQVPDTMKGIRIRSATNDFVVMLSVNPPEPILSVSTIQLSVPIYILGQLDISVKGTVTSSGWTQPVLVANEYIVPPQDGIYEFTFSAVRPATGFFPAILPIEVTHRLSQLPAGMTGIRVNSGTNNILIMLTSINQELLDMNRIIWFQSGIQSYQYIFQESCFCVPVEDVNVGVIAGTVTSAIYTPSGATLADLEFTRMFTILTLFSTIQKAIDNEFATVEVKYNPIHGYPEIVSIDWDTRTIDDEVVYYIKDLKETLL